MTEEPAFGAEPGRLARAVGHGPDFQILIVEAVADEATRMAREAIDHVAEERGLRVAKVCWDPAADAEGLERLIVAAASDVDLIHLSGASDWLTPERWQGLNIRRDRLAESARARLVWWLHPRNVAEMATQAPDLWAWRGGVYSFLDVASPSVSPLTSFDFPHEAWVNRADPGPRRKRIREIRTWLEGAPQPELVYEVAREWGDLALSLGEFDEARHAYRDIALPAARLHHTSREVLAMKDALATVASEAGDFGGAIEILKDATEEAERVLGADHPDTLRARNNLAAAYYAARRVNEAIPLFEETLTTQEQLLGPTHPSTLHARNNLALAYREVGRLNKAIPLLEETLTTREELLGPDHPDTLSSRNNLAGAYRYAGRLNDAIPLHEKTLETRTQLLGPNHPDTLVSRNNLALAYQDASRLNDAIPLFEETLDALTQLLGPNHPHTLHVRNNLALAYQEVGRLNDAIPLFEETLKARTRILGPNHPDTLTSRHNLAGAYRYAGRLNDAIPLHEKTLEALTQLLGPNHPDTLASRRYLAKAYATAGKPFRSEEQPGTSP